MRLISVAIALGLLMLGVAACGAPSGPVPGVTETVTNFTTAPSFPGESSPIRLTAEQTKGLTSTPWVLRGVSKNALDLQYVIGSPVCDEAAGIYIDETPSEVEIGTYSSETPGQSACADSLLSGYYRVRLAAPLGSRALVHVKLTREWANASNPLS